jgi:hypothetical protein
MVSHMKRKKQKEERMPTMHLKSKYNDEIRKYIILYIFQLQINESERII